MRMPKINSEKIIDLSFKIFKKIVIIASKLYIVIFAVILMLGHSFVTLILIAFSNEEEILYPMGRDGIYNFGSGRVDIGKYGHDSYWAIYDKGNYNYENRKIQGENSSLSVISYVDFPDTALAYMIGSDGYYIKLDYQNLTTYRASDISEYTKEEQDIFQKLENKVEINKYTRYKEDK